MSPTRRVPTLRLTLQARAENLAVVRQAIGGVAAEAGCSPDLLDDIRTAVTEVCANAVVHAYPDAPGPIEVSASVQGRRLKIEVRDYGIGIQPAPIDLGSPSLRVGLALVGALTDDFRIQGELGEGTEVAIGFDLDEAATEADSGSGFDSEAPSVNGEETRVAVAGATPGGAAIPPILELFAARADLSVDRLSDVQIVGDLLSRWNGSAAVDSRPLEISLQEAPGSLALRIGPLDPGVARKLLEESELPGFGNAFERLADRVRVDEAETLDGPAEFLTLEILERPAR